MNPFPKMRKASPVSREGLSKFSSAASRLCRSNKKDERYKTKEPKNEFLVDKRLIDLETGYHER